jgi:signal transduction histidine kinase
VPHFAAIALTTLTITRLNAAWTRAVVVGLRFGTAIATIGLVVLVDHISGELIDDGSQFLLMGTAVMATAWLAGSGPALLATVTGAVFGAGESAMIAGGATSVHLALFVVHGLLITAVVAEMQRARLIAERQAAEAQQARLAGEAANRTKDEFLATISHELRTPLNAVLGWVQLIRSGTMDSATERRGFEAIERNVRQQAQITGDLLDVSQALTGRLQLESRPVSLADAARQARHAALPAALARRVQITSRLPEEPVDVLGDPERLRQIAWHLLANAIKFTPSEGEVVLTVEASGDEAVLTVRDSGPGIEPAFLPRVFDAFTQADGSPTRTAGGLGVGLALVRELVELHGGRVAARNGKDGGAVFLARFPLQRASGRAPEAAPVLSPPNGSHSLDGVRVLVFDRDRDGREVMEAVLQQQGAVVRTVDSVADALESLEGWKPDVLVSDYPSPDGDKYSVVGKVHALDAERGGRIPALALTRFAQTDQRGRQMLAGTLRDLPKPLEPAVLAAEIARLTGRDRRHASR